MLDDDDYDMDHAFTAWRGNEFGYCRRLVNHRGDDRVGRDPKTIATYLRVTSSQAYDDGEYEISARLAKAAICINEDARNNHAPNWTYAEKAVGF